MKNTQALKDLFERYLRKECTPEEKAELFRLMADPAYEARFQAINEELTGWPEGDVKADEETTEQVWTAIEKSIGATKETDRGKRPNLIAMRWRIAAAACILMIAAAWIYTSRPEATPATVASTSGIRPGSKGAVLTLADGRTVSLDSLQTGWAANEQGVALQMQQGQLTYQQTVPTVNGIGPEAPLVYNTITTPRGRHFQLMLADGTKVWLNAASSLRYPAAFGSHTRTVEVEGEAYFEVAPDRSKPFIVQVQDKAQIVVLGTHFNVNAYDDEAAVTTTLLEGKVKISAAGANNNQPIYLLPNQECVLQGDRMQVNAADVETAVAWIKGMFHFKSAELGKVLRIVARWYDVEIDMDKNISARFSGSIYRSEDFFELMKIIGFASNVEFTVNGKQVNVSSK